MQQHQAIVLGSGIAGLMAARVLSDHFTQVVILEKDRLSSEVENRRGVPQGRHAHAILAWGLEGMEALLPGLGENLVDQGAVFADIAADVLWYRSPGFKARFHSGLAGLMLSRALLEHTLRLRVSLLANVRFGEGIRVKGLLWEGGQVRGERFVQGELEAEMEADLVVDAMGRGSPSLARLEAIGYPRPEESKVPVDIAYASRIFRSKPRLFETCLEGAKGMSVSPVAPRERRGGFLSVLEGDRFIATQLSKTIRPLEGRRFLNAASVSRGWAIFSDPKLGNCATCHSGPLWTLSRLFFTPADQTNKDLTNLDFTGPGHTKMIQAELTGQPGVLIAPAQVACVLRNLKTFGIPGHPAATDALEKKGVAGFPRAQGEFSGFNIPGLFGLQAGAPFLYHGQAKNLQELFGAPWNHQLAGNPVFTPSGQQLEDLSNFLLSIDANTPPEDVPAGADKCPAHFP